MTSFLLAVASVVLAFIVFFVVAATAGLALSWSEVWLIIGVLSVGLYLLLAWLLNRSRGRDK